MRLYRVFANILYFLIFDLEGSTVFCCFALYVGVSMKEFPGPQKCVKIRYMRETRIEERYWFLTIMKFSAWM